VGSDGALGSENAIVAKDDCNDDDGVLRVRQGHGEVSVDAASNQRRASHNESGSEADSRMKVSMVA
jgi:hypothetical protein